MMGNVMVERGEGERIEARRRRFFWLSIGVMAAAGAGLGFVVGATAALKDLAIGEIWIALPQLFVVALLSVSLAGFLYGTWRFYKAIDEVELVDNLWGSTAACYIYAILFPLWWALSKAQLVSAPDDWAIFYTALGGGMLAYLWRKWRAR